MRLMIFQYSRYYKFSLTSTWSNFFYKRRVKKALILKQENCLTNIAYVFIKRVLNNKKPIFNRNNLLLLVMENHYELVCS